VTMPLSLERDRAPGTRRDAPWCRTEDLLAARVDAMQGVISDAVRAVDVAVDSPDVPGDLSEAVSVLTRWCVALLSLERDGGGGLDDTTRVLLRRSLADLQELGSGVLGHNLSVRARRLVDCDLAVERLRAIATPDALLEHACEELVRGCHFGRAVLSRVDGGVWRPWMAYFADGSARESWFNEWIDRAIPLDDLVLEASLLTDQRPVAVYDTRSANVHRPIIVEAGHSDSYVAAPVVVSDSVIGFVHADHAHVGRQVDAVDRDVVWAFAQRFAQLYERAVLAERLGEQREHLRRALASVDDALDAGCLDDERGSGTLGRAVPTFGPGDGIEQLTARESEVLALVAVGATNVQIADRLMVSESTVKTHVKHILRKLGAANRAQAISQYFSG
jgi:DNA-binding CsgD family transcriptional regulator